MDALSLYDFDAVSIALRKAKYLGSSVLETPPRSLFIPPRINRKGFYGEQLFSALATGRLKEYDILGSAHLSNWRNQGFDVSFSIPPNKIHPLGLKFLVEVKTLYDNTIFQLSDMQRRRADILAVYNPKSFDQSFTFEGVLYNIPKKCYRCIKLH